MQATVKRLSDFRSAQWNGNARRESATQQKEQDKARRKARLALWLKEVSARK